MKEYKCVCGKCFKSKQALVGHYANCLHHKEDLKQRQQKETDERIARSSVLISKSLTGRCTSPIWTDKRRKKMTATCKKNKKSGGYRKNGGKGKRGRYKGFWCDSSWELAYVIWNLEHNVKFSRNTKGFPYVFENEVHQYHPDFLLEDGTYVEIKGWYDNKTLIKHQTFRDLGYKLQVIDKNNIEMYLTYAVKKYGNDFIRLYEET